MASLFESYERRIDKINAVLAQYGINGVEDAKAICAEKGLDPYKTCEETQPICFENAKWAYVVGAAIAIKKGARMRPTPRGDRRGVAGILHSRIGSRRPQGGHRPRQPGRTSLREETQCFAFLAGHESFAAAEGAIKIAEMPTRCARIRCA